MADGAYERRGPREAELRRMQRILAESAKRRREKQDAATLKKADHVGIARKDV